MAEAGYNESSVVLPSLFGSPGDAMENALSRQQQDKRFEYQVQKENEMDDWRKVNLIRELTDLSQYQTPDSAANKIGSDRANEILQKYTSGIKNMSPAQLLANIQKDMQDTHIGMEAIKNDFAQAHQAATVLKQQMPSIDAGRIERDLRADIARRRLKGDTAFVPQMDVDQNPGIDLNNPEVLSDYVLSDEKLREGVLNPRKEKAGVATGNIVENVEYGGDVPFYSDVNYTPEQKKDGFLPKGFKPTYKPKEVPISTDVLKGKNGEQLIGVPEEVLNEFSEGERGLQLLQATKKKFPNYKELSAEQKQAAMSNTLRERLGDEKELPFITSKRAPVQSTHNTINLPSAADVNDVYGRIYSEVKRLKDYGEKEIKPNLLKGDEQSAMQMFLDNLNKSKTEEEQLKLEDTWIKLSDQDEVLVLGPDRRLLFTLPKLASNLKNTPTAAGKKTVVQQGEPDKAAKPGSVKNKGNTDKPKTVTQNGVTYKLNEKTGEYVAQ